ncbi:MAG UNVERIFIED_CONTAM: hypothetical protein LVR18_08840 [Planctomycetaceae bacterium]
MKPWIRYAAALALSAASSLTLSASAQDKVTFEDHVKPILRDRCLTCHNTNKKSSDLDLSTYTTLMQGGASGASIEPGDSNASYLFGLVAHTSEPYMPPNADKIPDAEVEILRKWIDAGAPETSSSKVVIKKKNNAAMSVSVSAGARPEGPAPLPDVLNLAPVVKTTATTAVSAIATNPWSKLTAVAGQKQVVLYHTGTMEALGVLPFPEGRPRVLKFSRNGSLLLAGGGRGASKGLCVVWDVRTGERLMTIGDELDEVLAADISADQSMVALAGPQKVVRVYSTATGELSYECRKHTDWVYSLEFSPDGVLLASADRSGGVHVWEAQTGREYLTLTGHTGPVYSLSWRIDGNVLASGSEDTTIRLWEMENGGQIKSWGAHGGGVFSIEFCRDGRIVSSGRDKVAKLWDANGGAIRNFEAFNDLALQVTHCDETDRVIAGDWTGEVRVWNAADGGSPRKSQHQPTNARRTPCRGQRTRRSRNRKAQSIHGRTRCCDGRQGFSATENRRRSRSLCRSRKETHGSNCSRCRRRTKTDGRTGQREARDGKSGGPEKGCSRTHRCCHQSRRSLRIDEDRRRTEKGR